LLQVFSPVPVEYYNSSAHDQSGMSYKYNSRGGDSAVVKILNNCHVLIIFPNNPICPVKSTLIFNRGLITNGKVIIIF
jgi:hypothetical protein